MKYEVTKRGVYDAKGEMIEIGTEIEVKGDKQPGYLIGKSVPVKGGKTAVTNPKDGALPGDEAPAGPFTVTDGGNGWWSILNAKGEKVGKGLREDDAKAFDTMSDEDKTAFAAEHAKA